MENRNKKENNYKIIIAIIIALLLLSIGFYLYYFYPQIIPGMASTSLGKYVNVVIIGIDDLESVKKGSVHADSIVFAQLSTRENKLKLTNIVMETDIFEKDLEKQEVEGIMKEIEDITSKSINYYFTISYQGFINIIDSLGGISITRKEVLRIPDLELDLKPGINNLSGQEALNYARWYNYKTDERERIERQQQVISGLIEKAVNNKTLLDIPEIFNTTVKTFKSVKTNIEYTLITDIVEYLMKNKINVDYNSIIKEEIKK